MIRIAIYSKRFQNLFSSFQEILHRENIVYSIEQYNSKKQYDIYVIDIQEKRDLFILEHLQRNIETLVYVIGPEDFQIAHESIRYNIHLYLKNNQIQEEINHYYKDIIKQIQERFQYYIYQRHGIESQIRLSQIYYVESLRHQIIIHSINGDFVERKNLSDFLKQISSHQFIQIHKSFIINKQFIEIVHSQEIRLKNKTVVPIGRAFKDNI